MSPLCLGDGALESLDVVGHGAGSQQPWGERSTQTPAPAYLPRTPNLCRPPRERTSRSIALVLAPSSTSNLRWVSPHYPGPRTLGLSKNHPSSPVQTITN